MVYHSVLDLIGKTPIVELERLNKEVGGSGYLYAKLDSYNPGGSAKDRIAYAMLLDAKEKGLIHDKSIIVESTSGNTGIGLAMVCSVLNIECILCMPSTMTSERVKLIQAYGAKIELTDGSLGMNGANNHAAMLCETMEGAISLKQFDNMANPNIHYVTTGPEIYEQMDGLIDVFIAGIGTGGTISGVSKYLKEKMKDVEIIGIEPKDSPLLSSGKAGPHRIQGIGTPFIPNTLDQSSYDRLIQVRYEEAKEMAQLIGKKEGILVGVSGGAALFGAKQVSLLDAYKDKHIVVFLPDEGSRYLSTDLYD